MEAFEEGEKEKLLKAQEMLNEAQADLKTVSSAKQNYKEAEEVAPVQTQPQPQGYDPTDNDFYQEIDKRINKAFSQNTEETTERVQESSSKPAQVVSGSSRSSPSSAGKVKLSKEDVRLAQKWNIPLEQYAAEKLKVDGADGNYTNIT